MASIIKFVVVSDTSETWLNMHDTIREADTECENYFPGERP